MCAVAAAEVVTASRDRAIEARRTSQCLLSRGCNRGLRISVASHADPVDVGSGQAPFVALQRLTVQYMAV